MAAKSTEEEIRELDVQELEKSHGGTTEGAPPPQGAPPGSFEELAKRIVDAVKSWF